MAQMVLLESGALSLQHRPIEREIRDVFGYESVLQFFKDKPDVAMCMCMRMEEKLTVAYLICNDKIQDAALQLKAMNEMHTAQFKEIRDRVGELKERISEMKQHNLEQRNDWAEQKRILVADSLRSKGLLTARGIFERYLQLVAIENGIKGKFNATNVLGLLKTLPVSSTGSWTEILVCGIQTAIPAGRDISDYATGLYAVLCRDIHGHPWTGDAVQLLFDESKHDEKIHLSVLRALCKGMGLIADG